MDTAEQSLLLCCESLFEIVSELSVVMSEVLPVSLTLSRSHSQPSSPRYPVFTQLQLDNIRACVYPELGTALPLTARIEGEVWISILMSVIGHWLLSGLTIMITTHNTNQTHVEFCPTYPPVISIDFLAFPTWNLAVLDLLSPLREYDKC